MFEESDQEKISLRKKVARGPVGTFEMEKVCITIRG